jgi:hypothetical protein
VRGTVGRMKADTRITVRVSPITAAELAVATEANGLRTVSEGVRVAIERFIVATMSDERRASDAPLKTEPQG